MKKHSTLTNVLLAAAIVSLGFSGAAMARVYDTVNGEYGYWEGGEFFVEVIPPTPDPVPQNDIVYSFQKEQDLKLITPTDLNPIPRTSFNFAGTQTAVNPLEKTKIVNTIDTNKFANQDVGAIAINNSDEHTIASNGMIPVGAANKVNENEFQTLGAAYKVENDQNYDFVISEPILK